MAASFTAVHSLTCPKECYTSTIMQLQRRVVELERLVSNCESRHRTLAVAPAFQVRRPLLPAKSPERKGRMKKTQQTFPASERFGSASMLRQLQSASVGEYSSEVVVWPGNTAEGTLPVGYLSGASVPSQPLSRCRGVACVALQTGLSTLRCYCHFLEHGALALELLVPLR